MSKELLKTMLQHVINDRHDEANADLHQYLVAKSQSINGMAVPEARDDNDDDSGDDDDQNQEHEIRIMRRKGSSDIRDEEILGKLEQGGVEYDDFFNKGDRVYFTVKSDEGAPLEQLFGENWDIEYM